MPITFAPAEPLSTSTSEGYGAAEQFDRTLPIMQRYQQGAADAYLQAAALRQRAVQSSAALQLQGAEQTHALDQRANEAQLHAQMQMMQMGHQSDMQAQHAQLQDQLASNQLSRGEQLRLQRLQEARGSIQDMVNSGSLTADEGRNALMEIQTGINPLQQRQQRSQQQHLELQNQLLQRQTAQFDQLQREREQYRSQSAQDHLETVTMDDGQDYQFHRDEQGRRTFLGARGSGAAVYQQGEAVGGTSGSTRTRSGGQSEGPQPFNPQVHAAALRMAQAATARDEAGHARPVQESEVQRIYETMMGQGQDRQAQTMAQRRQQAQSQAWQEVNQLFPNMPIAQRRQLRDQRVAEVMGEAARGQAQESQARREATEQADRVLGGVNRMAAGMGSVGGVVRQRMIDEGKPDLVVAFPAGPGLPT